MVGQQELKTAVDNHRFPVPELDQVPVVLEDRTLVGALGGDVDLDVVGVDGQPRGP
jgi:hypothetical protein